VLDMEICKFLMKF